MRKMLLAAACLGVGYSVPACAAYTVTGIFGDTVRTTEVLACNAASAPGCFATTNTGTGSNISTYTSSFFASPSLIISNEGDTTFTGLQLQYQTFFTFTINNASGILTGKNLSINYQGSNCAFGNIGCILSDRATASAFGVAGGVPEPGTWLMMLVGFAAVGASLRQARRKKAQNARSQGHASYA